jgi:hypothetical protein
MVAFPTDYYAVAAQVMPLFYVIAMVEERFLSGIQDELDRLVQSGQHAAFNTVAWTYLVLFVGVLASFVLGEVNALRALEDGSASDVQEGYVICGLATGGILLVWFPLRIPLRKMKAGGTGATKIAGRVGNAILGVMLAVAALGPLVFAWLDLLGAA